MSRRVRISSRVASTKTCRCCGTQFLGKAEVDYHRNGCCGPRCYLEVGPSLGIELRDTPLQKLVVAEPSKTTSQTKWERKQQRKRDKQHRGQKRNTLNYKGRDSIYNTADWLALRYEVLKRYGRYCMLCGSTSGSMHVDHILPKSKYPHLALDFDNMQVLCADCNLGKSNKDLTDFRYIHEDTPTETLELRIQKLQGLAEVIRTRLDYRKHKNSS